MMFRPLRSATALGLTALFLLQNGCATPRASEPVHDVPRVSGITIDGRADDWQGAGFAIDVLTQLNGQPMPANDLDGRARLGWTDRGLVMLLHVGDDAAVEADESAFLWQADGVELYLSSAVGEAQMCQWLVAPGMAADQPSPRWHLHDHRKDAALKQRPAALEVARTKTARGYVLEVLMPWQSLAIEPTPGEQVGFQFWINDADRADQGRLDRILWYPGVGVFAKPDRMHHLRLADQASAPVDARLSVGHDLGRLKTVFTAVARPEAAGQPVHLVQRASGKVLAEATFGPEAAGYCIAEAHLPLPEPGQAYGQVGLRVGQRIVDQCDVPGVDNQRRRIWQNARIVLDPFVFDGERLPTPRFERPLYVEQVAGRCTFETTYYDADYKQVTAATRPGRYGAIVTVTPERGAPRKAFFTLYRTAGPIAWRQAPIEARLSLPEAFGVDAAVLDRRTRAVGERLKRTLAESVERSDSLAVLLAGLHEADPDEPDVVRTRAGAKNERWWHGLKKKTGNLEPLPYAVQMPEGITAANATQKYPAVIFLHGSGQRGIDPQRLLKGDPARHFRENDLPVIVVAPVCPPGQWWSAPQLRDLVDHLLAAYPIDADRLYLTGLSLGGFGTWTMLAEHPDLFAAAAPVCGAGDPRDVARFKHVPIWVFHGERDMAVPVDSSRRMVEALRKVDGNVKYTEYPGVGHASWAEAYADPAFYRWLLNQRRERRPGP